MVTDTKAAMSDREYEFHIEAYTPETIPMRRLAEYMTDLAALVGHEEHVHFVRVDPGSTNLKIRVDEAAVPEVQQRVISVREGRVSPDVLFHYENINRRLAEDHSSAVLRSDQTAEIIQFPGVAGVITVAALQAPSAARDVVQEGALEGILVKIGGFSDPIPFVLEWGDIRYQHIYARRALAKELGPYYLSQPIRIFGTAKWRREENGFWHLLRFDVSNFEVIQDTPLKEVVRQLRAIRGNGWDGIKNPIGELLNLRGGNDETE